MIQEYNLILDPHLSLLRITHRKIRRNLFRLVVLLLIVFGLYGIYHLLSYFIGGYFLGETLRLFYLSALGDLMLFFLWQRQKEKVKKVTLPEAGERLPVHHFFDGQVQVSFEKAWLSAFEKKHQFLRPIHLFAAFLKIEAFNKILKRLDCPPKQVKEKVKVALKDPGLQKGNLGANPQTSPQLEQVFFAAYKFCLEEKTGQISFLDLLWAMSQGDNLVNLVFDEFGVSPEEIRQAAIWAKNDQAFQKWQKSFGLKSFFKPRGDVNRAMTAMATPNLNKASEDFTALAQKGHFEMIVDRPREMAQIYNLWSSGQAGALLMGPAGVGKQTIVQKMAQLMVEEKVPSFLQDKRLVKIDVSKLLSLAEGQRGAEDNFKKILYEANQAGNIILFIENIDNLVGLKDQAGSLDFAEILASALEKKAFYLIASCTSDAYASKLENRSLGRVLSPVKVRVPDKDLLLEILASSVFFIEKELEVVFSVDALNESIELARRYLYGQALTAKAIDLLEEAASYVRAQKGRGGLVEDKDLIHLVAQKTGVPLNQVQEVEKKKLLNLEKIIHQRLVNQEQAVEVVANALRRSRVDLQSREKPIANFLFVGPTGVGKTELARSLARIYFGEGQKMIRLDMSEYQEKRSLRKIIGARTETGSSQGYLTQAVKRQPHSLILLDELEKAHPDVLNLFLQVMDEGRLTNAAGETINFTSTIIIATSNAGTKFIQDQISQNIDYEKINKELKERVLLQYFSPEFLNRFDGLILFKPLTMENMLEITEIFLNQVRQKLEKKGVLFEIEEEALKEIALAGYDPLYGARPLQRVIQEKINDELAKLFLEDKIQRRDKVIMKKGGSFEIIKGRRL